VTGRNLTVEASEDAGEIGDTAEPVPSIGVEGAMGFSRTVIGRGAPGEAMGVAFGGIVGWVCSSMMNLLLLLNSHDFSFFILQLSVNLCNMQISCFLYIS
jgi:hypothetical protein